MIPEWLITHIRQNIQKCTFITLYQTEKYKNIQAYTKETSIKLITFPNTTHMHKYLWE